MYHLRRLAGGRTGRWRGWLGGFLAGAVFASLLLWLPALSAAVGLSEATPARGVALAQQECPPADEPGSGGSGTRRETRTLLAGTRHATPMYVLRSEEAGPTVLVVGGLHGNDPAGVDAARSLAETQDLERGTLIVVPELNRQAVAAGRRYVDVDLNRAFPSAPGEHPADPRAEALWNVMRDYGVGYLLDLHEDSEPWTTSGDIGNVLIYSDVDERASDLATAVLDALNAGVSSEQRWRSGGPPISGGLTRSAQDLLGTYAYYVSTSLTNPRGERVEQHLTAAATLLRALQMRPGGQQPPGGGDGDTGSGDGDTGSGDGDTGSGDGDTGGGSDDAQASVTRRTLMAGTEFETPLYVIDSGRPGPTVWVSGGVHGSEVAAWRAAEQVVDWRVRRGRLIVLPRASAPAVRDRQRSADGYGDLNRDFPHDGDSTPDNGVAEALWSALQRYDPDWVLDLHEALSNRNFNPDSVGQTIIVDPRAEMEQVTRTVIDGINRQLPSRLEYQMLRYPVRGSLARGAGDLLDANAAIVETSRLYDLQDRISWHLTILRLYLRELDMGLYETGAAAQPVPALARPVPAAARPAA